MKAVTLIILLLSILYGCSNESERLKLLEERPFFISKISWDTNHMETFGDGEIIYFASDFQLKVFCNSFLHNLDSLSWGEPGIILKTGTWKINEDKIICNYKTIYRTFRIEPTEKNVIDTFYFLNKSLRNKYDTFSSDVLMTKEVFKFIKQDWSKIH
jgi:hypothetical protein